MSKKKKKCTNCGAVLTDESGVCPVCGFDPAAAGRVEDLTKPRAGEDGSARPQETARKPKNYEAFAAEKRAGRKKTWQFTVVLAVIVAIIVVAVILVLKMTEKTEPVVPSETYDTIHVISQDGEEITATASPDAEPMELPAVVGESEAEDEIVFTETDDTVLVASSGASLRSGASTTFEVIASLAKDTELHRTGVSETGWSRVEYEGETAFISSSLLTAVEKTAEETGETEEAEEPEETAKPEETPAQSITGVTAASGTVKVISDANLRKGPGTGYDAVAVAKAGTELTLTGTISGWDRIEYNGETLFIASSLVSSGSSAATSSSSGTLKVTQKANVRSGAGTDYTVLGVVDVGTTLTSSGMSGTWYIVDYNGQTGYINRNMVSSGSSSSGSTSSGTSASGTLKVTQKANVRSGAGTGYTVLGVVDTGTSLSYSGMSGTWYIVDYNGQTGYINRKMVSAN